MNYLNQNKRYTTELTIPTELNQFIEDFLADRVKELKKMKADLAEKNFKELEFVAHKWKGFCKPYGFEGLGNISFDLEANAAEGNFEECSKLIDLMQTYLDEAAKQLGFDFSN